MDITKPEKLILIVVIINSCLALTFNIISIVTNEWIVSNATNVEEVAPSTTNYGLFSGYLKNYILLNPLEYDLTITCNYGEGKCMYSCQTDSDKRQNELKLLLTGIQPEACDRKSAKSFFNVSLKFDDNKNKMKLINKNSNEELPKNSLYFIGSGFWVCSLMFLIIDLLFSTASCIFAIINLFWNPIEPILNIFGLYIWNFISVVTGLLTMIIWGSLFEQTLKYNIAITDTLSLEKPYNSNGLASLGYSYFILLGAILLNSINIFLLFLRRYLLSKVPPPVVIHNKSDDTMLTFY